jgi:hypothetical protein
LLTDYEVKVLKECNGEPQDDLRWGAAMSVTLEYLRGDGYLQGYSKVTTTDKGRDYLNHIRTPVENEGNPLV